jgi:protein-disulfide isomerase
MSRVECINEKGAPIEDRCVAARAAFCAGMQDHFWEFNDAFIADPRPGELGARREHVLKLAERLGFDKRLFSKCMDRPETISHAENIHLDGLKRGVQSTPTYFAADKKMNAKQLYAFIRSL